MTFFGGLKAVVRPDPIPNSAVKHSVADGSGLIDSARVGSRQSFRKAETRVSAFFFVRPAGRTDLLVKVQCTPGKGKC